MVLDWSLLMSCSWDWETGEGAGENAGSLARFAIPRPTRDMHEEHISSFVFTPFLCHIEEFSSLLLTARSPNLIEAVPLDITFPNRLPASLLLSSNLYAFPIHTPVYLYSMKQLYGTTSFVEQSVHKSDKNHSSSWPWGQVHCTGFYIHAVKVQSLVVHQNVLLSYTRLLRPSHGQSTRIS